MVAFVTSIVITVLMIGIAILVANRRAPGTPLTWAEAIGAAVYCFAVMLLVYGIVPDQWMRWADNELQWRKDAYLVAPGSSAHKIIRIVITKEAIRDVVASGIYVVGLVGHVWLWMWWQNRGKAKPAAEVERSAFGRPLVRAGGGG